MRRQFVLALIATIALTSIIVAAAQPPATTKKIRRQIDQLMRAKGILIIDLPPAALSVLSPSDDEPGAKPPKPTPQQLNEVLTVVRAILIDNVFVQVKMTRINRMFHERAKNVTPDERSRVERLLDQISDGFSDGRYDRANKKINQLYKLLKRVPVEPKEPRTAP